MKFSAKQSGLMKGLAPVLVVATTGVKREFADGFKITLSVDANGITALAFNGYVAITHRIENQPHVEFADAEPGGNFTLNASDFVNSVSSFSGDDTLNFERVGNELVIKKAADPEEMQSLPIEPTDIELPSPATQFDKEVSFNRELFLAGMDKVLFAVGFEKFRPDLLHWILRVRPDVCRMASGDGGRFAAYEIEGKNIVQTTNSHDICIYKEQSPVFYKVLKLFEDTTFDIREFAKKDKKDDDALSDQIVIKVGSTTMFLVGHKPETKWPNEDKFLKRTNQYFATTLIDDWEFIVKGVLATFNEQVRKTHTLHTAELEFDFDKKLLTVKTDGTMKSLRKIKLRDCEVVGDVPKKLKLNCTSSLLDEVYKQGKKGEKVQFELLNDKAVVMVRYYAGDAVCHEPLVNVNQTNGYTEQYSIFFAPSNKKDKA